MALSTFTQSVGYLLAAAGLLSVGLLYEATGGWTASFVALLGALAIQVVAGLMVARPQVLEDEIEARAVIAPATDPVFDSLVDSIALVSISPGDGRSDGSGVSPVRAKTVSPGTVGATTGPVWKGGQTGPPRPPHEMEYWTS